MGEVILSWGGIIVMLLVVAWLFDNGLATDDSPWIAIGTMLLFGYIFTQCF